MSTFRDLSGTAITSLPTEGLREIDVLKVENTESLKVFPSVYNFKVNILSLLLGLLAFSNGLKLKYLAQDGASYMLHVEGYF